MIAHTEASSNTSAGVRNQRIAIVRSENAAAGAIENVRVGRR